MNDDLERARANLEAGLRKVRIAGWVLLGGGLVFSVLIGPASWIIVLGGLATLIGAGYAKGRLLG